MKRRNFLHAAIAALAAPVALKSVGDDVRLRDRSIHGDAPTAGEFYKVKHGDAFVGLSYLFVDVGMMRPIEICIGTIDDGIAAYVENPNDDLVHVTSTLYLSKIADSIDMLDIRDGCSVHKIDGCFQIYGARDVKVISTSAIAVVQTMPEASIRSLSGVLARSDKWDVVA